MGKPTSRESELPERDVDRLARRLNRHRLWNRLLAVLPPLLFLAYAFPALFVADRVGLGVWLFSWAAILGVGLGALLHFRTSMATPEEVAHLLDARSDGKEHFLTLANLHKLRADPWVVAKLRGQASHLLLRVNFRRDFPYQLRRASALSLVLSAAAILLLHFVLESPVLSLTDSGAALEKVQGLAHRLSRESGLQTLAMGAQRAAGDLRAKIRNAPMIKQVMEQLESQLGSGARDGQGSGEGGGSSTKKSERAPGGREQKNSAGRKQGQQGEGDGEGDSTEAPGDAQDQMANLSNGEQGERRPSHEAGVGEKETGSGGNGERDDRRQDTAKDSGPRDQGKREGGQGGTGKSDEDIPKGKEPDRFHPPGEGKDGIEGGRFVTVALPKTLASGGGQEGPGEEQGGSSSPPVPVGNVPLPPRDDPKAPGEKQHMPMEYEQLIN